ncbi:unnamed protein product [Tilletia caries]|nr:hypothetical protein CF335_g5731 [Tilletia laevis]CAD6912142.1 unnamed protein product [Tilletia caries]
MKSISLVLLLLFGFAAVSAAPAPFTTLDKPDTFIKDVLEARQPHEPQPRPPGPPTQGLGGMGGGHSGNHPGTVHPLPGHPLRREGVLEADRRGRPQPPGPPKEGNGGQGGGSWIGPPLKRSLMVAHA